MGATGWKGPWFSGVGTAPVGEKIGATGLKAPESGGVGTAPVGEKMGATGWIGPWFCPVGREVTGVPGAGAGCWLKMGSFFFENSLVKLKFEKKFPRVDGFWKVGI